MERPLTRSLLATFIEYAARDCVTPLEWSRFIVNHYGDEVMEAARVDCVRILQSAPPARSRAQTWTACTPSPTRCVPLTGSDPRAQSLRASRMERSNSAQVMKCG
jgi:hypothetical protein